MISVIVPTYNRAYMIGKTMESILSQTFKDLEIIVVDDGSTDNTEEVVKSYSNNSVMPIRYVRKENGGCASARNKGIDLAEGEYIAFLDSDDQFIPDAIKTLMDRLTSSNADFIYSPSIEVYEGAEFLALPAAAGKPEDFAKEHFLTTCARSCCILYRKEIFSKIRPNVALRYNEDSDFLQRVALNFKAAYSPIPTAKIFHHSGNKSGNRVAIYRALLKSSETILDEYPNFKKELGKLTDKRLNEIKINLIEALILSNNYMEAIETAAPMTSGLPLVIRLSLLFNSQLPMKIKLFLPTLRSYFYGFLRSLKKD